MKLKQMSQAIALTTIRLLWVAGLACAADAIDVSEVDTKYVADASYDGVHPSATGNTLLANLIGDGIFRALNKQQRKTTAPHTARNSR
jgi:hypothetical protein